MKNEDRIEAGASEAARGGSGIVQLFCVLALAVSLAVNVFMTGHYILAVKSYDNRIKILELQMDGAIDCINIIGAKTGTLNW